MLEYVYVILGLLVAILVGVVLLGISLRKRKEAVGIDATRLSEDIAARIKEDVSKAVRETVSEVSERVGSVSSTLKSVVELFEKMRSELPKDVKEPVNEVLERALRDLKEFDKNIDEMGKELPKKVLRSIQSGISVRKGRVGEFTTLIKLLAAYKRIIPLGQPVDFIGISDEHVDFIEVKTGTSELEPEEREIKRLIEEGRVRFILKREEVEITMPEEIEELEELAGREDTTSGFYYEDFEAFNPEDQNRVRDFVSANEIYGRVETRAYDNELFEKLRRLRMNIARRRNIKPYMVLHDSVLKEMATEMPTTKEEMMRIKGIRDRKYEEYGEIFINVIRTHLSERNNRQ